MPPRNPNPPVYCLRLPNCQAEYTDALVDMRSQLMAALQKVEQEMASDGIECGRTPTPMARPATASQGRKSRVTASSIGHLALGGQSRPQTAQSRPRTANRSAGPSRLQQSVPFAGNGQKNDARWIALQKQRSDPYVVSGAEQAQFDRRFDQVLEPAKKLQTKRQNQSQKKQ